MLRRVRQFHENRVWKSHGCASPHQQYCLGLKYKHGQGLLPHDLQKAALWFRKAAGGGHPEAQLEIGLCFKNGDGVDVSDDWAAFWFSKAVEQKVAKAHGLLGMCYLEGKGVLKDEREAVHFFRLGADYGDAESLTMLRSCIRLGMGMPKPEEPSAFEWCKRAAEEGFSQYMFELGERYFYGKGVCLDYEQAAMWYEAAAKKGHALARYPLAVCFLTGAGLPQSDNDAVKWLKKASGIRTFDSEHLQSEPSETETIAQSDYIDLLPARVGLGLCYLEGIGMVRKEKLGRSLIERAAFEGCEDAIVECLKFFSGKEWEGWASAARRTRSWKAYFQLSLCYQQGYVVARDDKEAYHCLQMAVEKAEVLEAAGKLVHIDWKGRALLRSWDAIVRSNQVHATNGDILMQEWLGFCLGTGVLREMLPRNDVEAAKWFFKAAESGSRNAQYRLGICLKKGLGIDKNLDAAKMWLSLSAGAADPQACQEMQFLCKKDVNREPRLIAESSFVEVEYHHTFIDAPSSPSSDSCTTEEASEHGGLAIELGLQTNRGSSPNAELLEGLEQRRQHEGDENNQVDAGVEIISPDSETNGGVQSCPEAKFPVAGNIVSTQKGGGAGRTAPYDVGSRHSNFDAELFPHLPQKGTLGTADVCATLDRLRDYKSVTERLLQTSPAHLAALLDVDRDPSLTWEEKEVLLQVRRKDFEKEGFERAKERCLLSDGCSVSEYYSLFHQIMCEVFLSAKASLGGYVKIRQGYEFAVSCLASVPHHLHTSVPLFGHLFCSLLGTSANELRQLQAVDIAAKVSALALTLTEYEVICEGVSLVLAFHRMLCDSDLKSCRPPEMVRRSSTTLEPKSIDENVRQCVVMDVKRILRAIESGRLVRDPSGPYRIRRVISRMVVIVLEGDKGSFGRPCGSMAGMTSIPLETISEKSKPGVGALSWPSDSESDPESLPPITTPSPRAGGAQQDHEQMKEPAHATSVPDPGATNVLLHKEPQRVADNAKVFVSVSHDAENKSAGRARCGHEQLKEPVQTTGVPDPEATTNVLLHHEYQQRADGAMVFLSVGHDAESKSEGRLRGFPSSSTTWHDSYNGASNEVSRSHMREDLRGRKEPGFYRTTYRRPWNPSIPRRHSISTSIEVQASVDGEPIGDMLSGHGRVNRQRNPHHRRTQSAIACPRVDQADECAAYSLLNNDNLSHLLSLRHYPPHCSEPQLAKNRRHHSSRLSETLPARRSSGGSHEFFSDCEGADSMPTLSRGRRSSEHRSTIMSTDATDTQLVALLAKVQEMERTMQSKTDEIEKLKSTVNGLNDQLQSLQSCRKQGENKPQQQKQIESSGPLLHLYVEGLDGEKESDRQQHNRSRPPIAVILDPRMSTVEKVVACLSDGRMDEERGGISCGVGASGDGPPSVRVRCPIVRAFCGEWWAHDVAHGSPLNVTETNDAAILLGALMKVDRC
ncbi:hypothetical protein CBR_g39722 [Chara braunii]|uniref:Uncharacterized protein n=1 Tax=Chara braunii TaxID=69332 RepID=A0A388LS61_CHABU|nr:hypothetical protein CBR_g39722 [Chara braunii]|eukprot:GBG85157.1 hypothetical protein CBR_g39722 [Chara braunii]